MIAQIFVRRIAALLNRIRPTSLPRKAMDITIENFSEKLPYVETSIHDAIFVSIDGEFTGLSLQDQQISNLDTLEERYAKTRNSTTKFLMVQFGLCTFHYDSKKNSYSNRAFNFYLWPKPFNRQATDKRFICQTSSIDFLSQHNFDFNKLFKEGISYMRPDEEERLKSSLEARQAKYEELRNNPLNTSFNTTPKSSTPGRSENIVVPEEHKDFIQSKLDEVGSWLKSENCVTPLQLDRCNPFQRRLLYQEVKNYFAEENLFMEPVNKVLEPNKRPERVIQISKINKDEQKRKHDEKNQNELNALDAAVGFSKVIQKVSSSRKLVVGHNMMMDLCFLVNQFIAPLPESLKEFKDILKEHLPYICDTKLMANTTPFKEDIADSSLEELLRILLQGKPFQMPQVETGIIGNESTLFGYYLKENVVHDASGSSTKYHDAGYDAYATGLCYLGMIDRLASLIKPDSSQPNSKRFAMSSANECLSIAKPFLNKLNMMRLVDIPYMNVAGEDIIPSREHVFYITFPAEWKTDDLLYLFSPSFGPVQVTWINDTSAFISLREHLENAKLVMSTINCSSIYNIMPYWQYKKLQQVEKCGPSGDQVPCLSLPTQLAASQYNDNQQTTGITPMIEKNISFHQTNTSNSKVVAGAPILPALNDKSNGTKGGIKRAASPTATEMKKRTKSGEEEQNKVFHESGDWE